MGVRRILISALAAPLLISLSACGDNSSVANPPIQPGPPSSPTPSSHPESPEHFIRRWAVEDTRIQRTGETARFRRMSQGCGGCTRLADLVDHIYRAGGFIHTRGWRVRKVSASDGQTFDLFVFANPTTYAESKDSSVRHLPSGPAHFELRLSRQGANWNVKYLVQVAS